MRQQHKIWWIVAGIVIALFFGEEILGALGHVVGSIIELSVAGLVGLAVVGIVFFVTMTVFGSVLIALAAGFVTLLLTGIGLFWPLLLCVGILYLMLRKKPRSV